MINDPTEVINQQINLIKGLDRELSSLEGKSKKTDMKASGADGKVSNLGRKGQQ